MDGWMDGWKEGEMKMKLKKKSQVTWRATHGWNWQAT